MGGGKCKTQRTSLTKAEGNSVEKVKEIKKYEEKLDKKRKSWKL